MSYRDKPIIDGQLTYTERRKSAVFGLFALLFGLGVPKLARYLGERGYLASTEALQWGSLAMAAICVAGGIIAYRIAQAQVRRDLGEGIL